MFDVDENCITTTSPCPIRDIERQKLRLLLRDAIAHLISLCRHVFLLYYPPELSIKAIAYGLSKSDTTNPPQKMG